MGSGNILLDGVNTFSGVFTRLWEITQELVPYFIEISIVALGITLVWKALKRIMNTTKKYTQRAVTGRDYYYGEPEDSQAAQARIEKEREYHKKHG